MRLIDADKLRSEWTKEEEHGTPDERWRPEREFARIIDAQPTVDTICGIPIEKAQVILALYKRTEQFKPESYYDGYMDGIREMQEEWKRAMDEAVMTVMHTAEGINVSWERRKKEEQKCD